MWFLKNAFLIVLLGLTGCATLVVDLATSPATSTAAKIKHFAGKDGDPDLSSCTLPCSIPAENGKYEVSIDAPGYYPAVVQFDLLMARNTYGIAGHDGHTPLVIPLIPRNTSEQANNTQ
jgi:hypothetical protein